MRELDRLAAAFLARERERRKQERDEEERRQERAAHLRAKRIVLDAIERYGWYWPGED